MKAVAYRKSLPITNSESLFDTELPDPQASGRDLLVRVRAISVNPVDTKIRKRTEPEAGEVKVLGWDVCGVVEATGEDVQLLKPGDEVWYAGAVDRQGANAELHVVDERIVARKPASLDNAHAAAMPLTSITAWELLFERLAIPSNANQQKNGQDNILLIMGGAGGVGSILTQLASKLTDATVIATASREETRAWVAKMGAHHVIDHSKPLADELSRIGISSVTHVASLTRSDLHFDEIIDALVPFGKLGMIDDPGPVAFSKLKSKSISLHWEFMFTRSMYGTQDMIEQHRLLSTVAALVDKGTLQSTFKQHFGKINAENLKRAHKLLESGASIGKVVLEGF